MEGATRGDGDPLDICIISERPINRAEVILRARVVGGLPMLDGGEADDKIVAVLEGDPIWDQAREMEDLPGALVARLRHYFMTYKMEPGQESRVSIAGEYNRAHAERVIAAAIDDYRAEFEAH